MTRGEPLVHADGSETCRFRHRHGTDYVLRGVVVAKAHREPEGGRIPRWEDAAKPHYTRFADTSSLVWRNRADAEAALAAGVAARYPGQDFPLVGQLPEEDKRSGQ